MYKPSIMLTDAVVPNQARTMRLRTVILIAMGIFLLPIALELALICYGQWCEVLEVEAEVHTPIIDSIGRGLADERDSLAEEFAPAWHAAMRDPYFALPLATICIVVSMAMLKR
jgi:hypothetical protein